MKINPIYLFTARAAVLASMILAGISSLSATEEKTILVLVTGAAKMMNGKPTGLWLEEFAVPYKVFTDAGYRVEVVTPKGGAAPIDPRSKPKPDQAAAWKGAAQRLGETKALAKVTAESFSAIFISGG
ncbi:MAG: hypothetical protein OSB19_15340 [Opitutaceae bacterium]|nr:hypothetical protein [Opitutaceae bacterium]